MSLRQTCSWLVTSVEAILCGPSHSAFAPGVQLAFVSISQRSRSVFVVFCLVAKNHSSWIFVKWLCFLPEGRNRNKPMCPSVGSLWNRYPTLPPLPPRCFLQLSTYIINYDVLHNVWVRAVSFCSSFPSLSSVAYVKSSLIVRQRTCDGRRRRRC